MIWFATCEALGQGNQSTR